MKKLVCLILVLGLASAANAGLVAHYELEDNANDSVGTQHGTEVGALGGLTYVQGKVGPGGFDDPAARACSFDGLDDYIDLGDGGPIEFSTGSFSIALWALTTSTAYCEMVGNGSWGWGNASNPNPTGKGYQMMTYATDYSMLRIDDANYHSMCRATRPNSWQSIGEWVHCVGIRNRALDRLETYKNGVLTTTWADSSDYFSIASPNEPGYIGRGSIEAYHETYANRFFDGYIDDVRFYDHALSQGEIDALVPEPATIALLGLGGLFLRRRK
jgi:hypothetical protein